jgi:hypothetical protein
MATHRCPRSHAHGRLYRFFVRWFVFNSLLAGVFALAWLVLRTGNKPSRLAYPCQQAAFATATAAFGGPAVAAILAIRSRVIGGLLTPRGIAVAGLGLVTTLCLWGYLNRTPAYRGPTVDPDPRYMAQVFDQTDCPHNPVGDRFYCIDDLIELMGASGLKLHQSSVTSLTAGPDGIIGADDVVVIKINYQWAQRGGTNTDVLRGLIRRIVDHPDYFTGEVVVCENTQFVTDAPTMNFDRTQNNAQDQGQSPHDVVLDFQAQGYRVSRYVWTAIKNLQVNEYSAGDMADGYIVYPQSPFYFGRVSYPKFQTAYGTRVSLKEGIWDGVTGYDRERLKFINVPVLKSHSGYGVTAMVKHYMGVVTGYLGTNSHSRILDGLLGDLQAEIGLADLNILDAIWINAHPGSGPSSSYGSATRTDRLLAARDPIAGDIWAVNNILIPAFEANGYTPPWGSADPATPSSIFRQYLDNSMNYLAAAGYSVTNRPEQINAFDLGPPGEASDPSGGAAPFQITRLVDGYELTWSDPVRGGPVETYNLYRIPLNGSAATPECEAALGGATTAFLSSLPDNHGFLVVANNSVGDGSFGLDDNGAERPAPLPADVCP